MLTFVFISFLLHYSSLLRQEIGWYDTVDAVSISCDNNVKGGEGREKVGWGAKVLRGGISVYTACFEFKIYHIYFRCREILRLILNRVPYLRA